MMETPFNEGPLSMRPLGFCDCDAPFYLIHGLIYYSCDRCKSGSPVGKCSICFEPVYSIRNKLHRTCNCGTATVGNITHTIGTITAMLYPQALTDATFAQITSQCNSEPLPFSSSSALPPADESLSRLAERENNGIEEITPDRVRRIYDTISLAMIYHASHCSDCDMLAEQGLMCPQWIQMSDSRKFWSKRLPDSEACSA